MNHPLLSVLKLPVPCNAPGCGEENFHFIAELVRNNEIACPRCNHLIPIDSEQWRASIEDIANRIGDVRKFPPVVK